MISRLSRRDDFDALRRHGRTVRRGSLRVRYLAGSRPEARVAYGIGRSVGNAVARNRLRRRLRVVMTGVDARGSLPAGDYLVRAEPSAAGATFAELHDDLAGITDELGSEA
ncbi:MAG TPA: ribonuclease P protein component [Acidimicrobiaceae bacterium]|nr:ribonuclease P protein component [Acidimicrobiaceae bacterium]MEC8969517.1 ribonuclease P protein component [Actinomycetota bacterium]MEC9202421.1 ribonuclease P protein component [Actinomycetota bacterium]MEE3212124.1 ribonuclease P protein component [Actinomycetota bacterium]MEE3250904.1 ribonuclease P protein component [Actinomycetota bacterium]